MSSPLTPLLSTPEEESSVLQLRQSPQVFSPHLTGCTHLTSLGTRSGSEGPSLCPLALRALRKGSGLHRGDGALPSDFLLTKPLSQSPREEPRCAQLAERNQGFPASQTWHLGTSQDLGKARTQHARLHGIEPVPTPCTSAHLPSSGSSILHVPTFPAYGHLDVMAPPVFLF